ncbi:hypothetical protein AAVH_13675 [Aphelenchoides avenae]|nr:hypothetical protein AAVH_13675 [Aphelenchus avenae]
MARIMLKLSAESAEIRERFGSVSEVIRFCNQAEDQKEVKSVRRQHADVAVWLKDIFKNDELRKGVTMDPKHGNFFTCPKLHTMSLAFKLKYMSKKATHAVFLMAPPDKKTLKSKGKWTTDTDPDTDPEYPGRISLEANRVVEFVPKKAAKDRRYWELYSAALTTRIRVDPENEATELHEFPLWYSHGANPPAGGTICHTWERQWRRKPESFTTDEACNRDALAEAMIFAATDTQTSRRKNNNKQQQRPERKSVLSELVDDVNSTERFAEDGRNAMVESADAGLERKHHG